MSKQQQERELIVVARYFLKKDYAPKGLHAGDIVHLVRNDKGVEYYVFLRKGSKAHSCTCPSRKRCYHIDRTVQRENTRYAASKIVVTPAQTVVEPKPTYRVLVASAKKPRKDLLDRMNESRESLAGILGTIREVQQRANEERMMKASLNQNKAFSVLR